MVVRISGMVLRIAGVLALILGIVFWVGVEPASLLGIHMLLGVIVTLALWVLGAVIAPTKGGTVLGITAFALGLIIAVFGMTQRSILLGNLHWIIKVVHLLLGLSAIGIGEMISGRYKRAAVAK
jgi:hypothetical protein